jgi:capsular polysaccharide biosynthesis protein
MVRRDADTMIGVSDARAHVEAPQSAQYEFTVQDVLGVLWRRFWFIALTMVALTGLAIGFSLVQTPMYEASIKILVRQEGEGPVPPNLGSDVQGLSQLTLTMAEAVDSRPVVEGVVRELNLQESPETFINNLNVEVPTNTQFIEVTYEHTSPEQAKRIVNALGDEFTEQISEVSPTTGGITATVWERAVTPDSAASPNIIRNVLLALVIAGMLGVSLAVLLEYQVDSWRSLEELERISGVLTLGVIPSIKEAKSKNWGN